MVRHYKPRHIRHFWVHYEGFSNQVTAFSVGTEGTRTGELISTTLKEPPSRLATIKLSLPKLSFNSQAVRTLFRVHPVLRTSHGKAYAALAGTLLVVVSSFAIHPQAGASSGRPQAGDDRIALLISDQVDPYSLTSASIYQSLAVTVVPGIVGIGGAKESQVIAAPRTYTIQKGDTLSEIAANYGMASVDVLKANPDLDFNIIQPGRQIIIPDTPLTDEQRQEELSKVLAQVRVNVNSGKPAVASGSWRLPLPAGSYTISRRIQADHAGIDMAAAYGTTVRAARTGCVSSASGNGLWNGGFGNRVVISSGGGLSVIYAHLSSVAVDSGDCVQAGDVIGYVGSTGNSTGPHLHFQPMINGVVFDPNFF